MKRNLILCAVCALLASCSSDDGFSLFDTTSYADLESVTLTAKPIFYDNGDETRTSLTLSGTSLKFSWANGDTIGLFPIAPIGGSQVYQVLSNKTEENSSSATFDGGAWKLKVDNTYAAYYPFRPDMRVGDSYDAIPVSMLGQKQVGKNSTAHLGDYDYMIAPASTVDQGTKNVNFNFDHVSAFIRLDLTMPAASWSKLVLESTSPVFITSAKVNIIDGTLKDKVYSKTIELDLENVTTSSDELVSFFISVLPVTTGVLDLKAYTNNNVEYKASVPLTTRTFESGMYKGWTKTMVPSGDDYDNLDYVDLGTGDGVLWGRENIVDTYNSVYDYFSWGGTDSQATFEWTNYALWEEFPEDGIDPEDNLCVPDDYNCYSGGNTVLDIDMYDVAHMRNGDGWRMPTREEMNNLVTKCDWEETTINGVSGYKVSNKTNPARYIFLPAKGKYTTSNENAAEGYYWTSTVEPEGYGYFNAYCLHFTNDDGPSIITAERYIGMLIRPVYVKQ